ncbi:MAG: hypothetical protein JNJ54_19450, partial [Myxococcaceae bacterium]|nr:hypothetical protein [Myxococcaceae bacterium]
GSAAGGSAAGGSAAGGSAAGGSAAGGSAGGGSAGCGSCPTGCCLNGVCQPGTSPLACGSGGTQCVACPLSQGCNNRMCTPCNSTTCPNGCCDINNTCQLGTSNLSCGLLGRACVSCGAPFGTSCQSQACVSTTNNGLAGSSCTSDLGCASGDGMTTGIAGSCIRATLDGGVSSPPSGFPNGYCSPTCPGGNNDCPAGTCLNVFSVGTCFANCPAPGQGRSTCRTGYVCDTLTDTASMMTLPFGVCFPACTSAGITCGGGTTCNTSTGYCQ